MGTYKERCVTLYFLVQLSHLALWLIYVEGRSSGCHVRSRFHSPYVTPLLEHVSSVIGCTSKEITSKSQEVHVLSLENTGVNVSSTSGYLPNVGLKVMPKIQHSTHAGPILLVLHSTVPVMWQLEVERLSENSRIGVVVTNQSQVVSAVSRLSRQRKRPPSLGRLLGWVRHKYGALTSLSRINMANSVTLYVGLDDKAADTCNTSSTIPPGNIRAVHVQPQATSGCVTDRSIRDPNRDIHIVELLSTSTTSEVTIHLQPQGHVQTTIDAPVLHRNLLLVLKCHVPLTWLIESWGIQGTLDVVAEHEVKGLSLPKYQILRVQTQQLAADTPGIMEDVQLAYGTVTTFTKAHVANRVNMIIVGKADGNEYNIQSDSSLILSHTPPHLPQSAASVSPQPYPDASTPTHPYHILQSKEKLLKEMRELPGIKAGDNTPYLFPKFETQWENRDLERTPSMQLIREMAMDCLGDRVRVSFPRDRVETIMDQLLGREDGRLKVTLSDPKCGAFRNLTHIILESTWDGCGAKLVTEGRNRAYYNQVIFWADRRSRKILSSLQSSHALETLIDDEDVGPEDGSGSDTLSSKSIKRREAHILVPLSFQCIYNITGMGDSYKYSEGMAHPHIYKMNLFLDKNFTNPIPNHAFPITVTANDYIFVESSVEAGPHMCVMVDECWLSRTNDPYHTTAKKSILIRNSCPADLSVEIIQAASCITLSRHPSGQRFSFQLSEDFVNEDMYLHCQLSVCATLTNIQLGGIRKCFDPQDYCVTQSLKPFLDGPLNRHFSLEVGGPFHIVSKSRSDKKDSENNGVSSLENSEWSRGKEDVSQQIILVGLSTEAIVGIAFASFVIGAGLMAILWVIHLQTDPMRQRRNPPQHMSHPPSHHHHHSGYDLSGHSGSSTPSSQAPMTVHACA